jgi:Flp pilus assembly protein TadD
MFFEPNVPACQSKVESYKRASGLMDEGLKLFEEGMEEEGLTKMTEAVELFPNDAGFLYIRGQAYLDANRLEEACQDLTRARDIALTDWFDGVLPIICR